jgi:hypothetical protein
MMQVSQQRLLLMDHQEEFDCGATGPGFVALPLQSCEQRFAEDIYRIRHVASGLSAS